MNWIRGCLNFVSVRVGFGYRRKPAAGCIDGLADLGCISHRGLVIELDQLSEFVFIFLAHVGLDFFEIGDVNGVCLNLGVHLLLPEPSDFPQNWYISICPGLRVPIDVAAFGVVGLSISLFLLPIEAVDEVVFDLVDLFLELVDIVGELQVLADDFLEIAFEQTVFSG